LNDERKTRGRSSGGMGGTVFIVTLILIILRATNKINIKWYWVFSPVWISAGLGLLFLIVIGFILFGAIIGIIGAGSAAVVGIKSWFGKQEQKESIDVESSSDDTPD
jgi:hypothetical protein